MDCKECVFQLAINNKSMTNENRACQHDSFTEKTMSTIGSNKGEFSWNGECAAEMMTSG